MDEYVDAEAPSDVQNDNSDSGDNTIQVSIDEGTICFRKRGGLQCWGRNLYGTVGDGTFVDRHSPKAVSGLSWVNEIGTDESRICARVQDGTVQCWGDNSSGQLGVGFVSDTDAGDASALAMPVPTPVKNLKGAVSLSNHGAGYASCAGTTTGQFICWGPDGFGELPGLPFPSIHATPIEVVAFAGARKVAMGADFTCAIFDGQVMCAGRNRFGELGDGTTQGRNVLAPVTGVANAIDLACRQGAAYALLADHTVVWWGVGVGSDGQIGEQHLSPVSLNLTGVQQIAAAGLHVCARMSDGSVQCAGLNDHGQLGDGTVSSRSTMAPVMTMTNTTLTDTADIAVGLFNSCAISTSGALRCWGGNEYGQMGNGTTGRPQTRPLLVGGL